MHPARFLALLAVASAVVSSALAAPTLPGVGAAMQTMIDKKEIAGAVTMVVSKDKILHQESTGFANAADKKAIAPDQLFRIASMTKPVTAVAILILQDEGKLKLTDPVAKYIPAFANLKTPSGQPANLTILQLLNHTSGLGEAGGDGARDAKTLADLVPVWLAAPMQYEPGTRWKYTQSGINTACRIVEVVSGMTFDAFLQKRVFDPLGMKDTTFYLSDAQRARVVTPYAKNRETGEFAPATSQTLYGVAGRPPLGNGGLFSTPNDYARFLQMLLGRGTLDGKRILSEAGVKALSSPTTGDLPTGFFQTAAAGQLGSKYAWGVGTTIQKETHAGVGAALSPGTFGHGGAWGTQGWVDPVKGVAYLLMVQRTNFPNSDGSDVRAAFQQAAADALAKK